MWTDLILSLPRPAAIIRQDLSIGMHNVHFAAVCDVQCGSIIDALAPAPGLAGLFLKEPGWRGAEIPFTDMGGRDCLYWCEVFTVVSVADGGGVHLLDMHDMGQYRALEAEYLHRIRRVADDNLWITADDTTLLWVRAENAALHTYIGRQAHDLVLAADRSMWDAAVEDARARPGEAVECTVRSSVDGKARMADICYISGGRYGGRFYAATRTDEPTGSRIVRRLKEAWQVRTDGELARAVGTSLAAISRANYEEKVPPRWLIRTGEETGASVDWLMTGQGRKIR